MMRPSPQIMIWIAAGMMVLGVVLPLLMVMQIVKSTFFLNFFSYALSTAGLFLGLIGAMTYIKERRR